MPTPIVSTLVPPKDVLSLDELDPLKHKRSEFMLSDDRIYMDGNSLGPLSKTARDRVANVVSQQWGNDLIHSWNTHNWIDLPHSVGDKIAPLIGAERGQVIACDSTSVNLFKVLASALALNPGRATVLSQRDNFPTDLYMVQGMSELLGRSRCTLKTVSEDQLVDNVDDSVAVLLLTEVNFRTGYLHNMKKLTEIAHKAGVLVIWDLAHSAGALDVQLDECNVDFAVGCGYKYLNGGPGAPAFIYTANRHHQSVSQPLSGWMGHSSPFDFEHDYKAGKAMSKYLTGTPNILSLASLDAALDVFSDVDISDLRCKSVSLSELFIKCVDRESSLTEFQLISPRDAALRGSQLAFSHDQAFAISRALNDHNVVVDFRAPNIIRFGLTPLYLNHREVWNAVQILVYVMASQMYKDKKYQVRSKVT